MGLPSRAAWALADILGARDNQRTFIDPAPIDFAYDSNRDARVNAYDMLIARDNQTHFLNALKLITVPENKAVGLQELPIASLSRENARLAAMNLAIDEHVAGIQDTFARDVALEQAFGRESSHRTTSSGKLLGWLYEFEKVNTHTRQARNDGLVKQAVDQLLFGELR